MPVLRTTKLPAKLPPPPELGERTFWDYFPRHAWRRIVFLLLALGAVLVLKHSGSWTFGGLLDGPPAPAPGAPPSAPVYHIKVTRPQGPEPAPRPPASMSQP
ncbi:MAG TPA: hypothetical protein VHL80_04055 [Polyangia bacterium]|nr:hypothetical protein [Polyangia bacterium]